MDQLLGEARRRSAKTLVRIYTQPGAAILLDGEPIQQVGLSDLDKLDRAIVGLILAGKLRPDIKDGKVMYHLVE